MINQLIPNGDLKLIVKIFDKEKNYLVADKIQIDYLDSNNELTKKHLASKCEVYFSSDINEREKDIDLKVNDLTSSIGTINKVDFTFFDGLDNNEMNYHSLDVYENYVILNLYPASGSALSELPFLETAISFLDNDSEEIVDFIFDDFKDEIYRYLNVKSKDSLEDLLHHDLYKVRENTYNYLTEFIDVKIKMMSRDNLTNFIKVNYDADFIFDEKNLHRESFSWEQKLKTI